jgi:hypothetical protein
VVFGSQIYFTSYMELLFFNRVFLWIFKNLDNFDFEYKMQSIENGDVKTLEDILPEHYQTNYRIAYWILKYGWMPSIALLLILKSADHFTYF